MANEKVSAEEMAPDLSFKRTCLFESLANIPPETLSLDEL